MYIMYTIHSILQSKTKPGSLTFPKIEKKKKVTRLNGKILIPGKLSIQRFQGQDTNMRIMTTKFCCHYLATWCQGNVFLFSETSPKPSNHQGTSLVFLVCCLKQKPVFFRESTWNQWSKPSAKLIQCNLTICMVYWYLGQLGMGWLHPKLINMGTWEYIHPFVKKNRLPNNPFQVPWLIFAGV